MTLSICTSSSSAPYPSSFAALQAEAKMFSSPVSRLFRRARAYLILDRWCTSIHQNEGLGKQSKNDSALMPCERRVVVKIGCEPKIDRDSKPVTGRVEPLLWWSVFACFCVRSRGLSTALPARDPYFCGWQKPRFCNRRRPHYLNAQVQVQAQVGSRICCNSEEPNRSAMIPSTS
jgi:hypothetical protein